MRGKDIFGDTQVVSLGYTFDIGTADRRVIAQREEHGVGER
ncbi:MAG: hypothetical protein WDN29_02690 [Methylovirgula sp.]